MDTVRDSQVQYPVIRRFKMRRISVCTVWANPYNKPQGDCCRRFLTVASAIC